VLLLTAYQPYFGLLPNATNERAVVLQALVPIGLGVPPRAAFGFWSSPLTRDWFQLFI